MKTCRRCHVSGKVQGVFFRAATRNRAQSLRIRGYAKNLDDGRVEVLACGEEKDVEALIDWLWQGPPAARVDRVDVEDAGDEAPKDFRTI
ncbi:MAG TPA: acylphosphatase [Gammaproteobacteria bacterium]